MYKVFRLCKCVQNTKNATEHWKQKACEAKSCVFVRNKHFEPLYLVLSLNVTSSSKKVFWSESGEKSAQIKHRLQTRTALNKYVAGFWCKRQQQMDFSLEEVLLWIMDYFLPFLFPRPDGLEWCVLLWCFYQLFGLSFWRHPFTAEHPLRRHWCRDTFLQIWWRNKLTWMAWRWVNVQQISAVQQLFL